MKYLLKLRKFLGRIGLPKLYLLLYLSIIVLILLLIEIEAYFNTDLIWVTKLYMVVIIVLSEVKILFVWLKYFRFIRRYWYRQRRKRKK